MIFELLVAVGGLLAVGALLIFAGGLVASWLTPLVPWSVDQNLGKMAHQQSSLEPECENPAVQKYVEQLAEPLIQAAGPLPFEFRFRVSSSDEINAFALPGGYVTVNYGLIEAAESGEEIAGVIGHEMQHALQRHGTKRMLRQLGGRALLTLFFGGSDLQILGEAGGNLAGLSYDRDQELEADAEGVGLLVKAGVDPRGLPRMFQRLAENQVHPPELLATHPDPGARAQLVQNAAVGLSFRTLPKPDGLACSSE